MSLEDELREHYGELPIELGIRALEVIGIDPKLASRHDTYVEGEHLIVNVFEVDGDGHKLIKKTWGGGSVFRAEEHHIPLRLFREYD